MDAGIADTINRRDAQLIARKLDAVDMNVALPGVTWLRWPHSAMADTMMAANAATESDRAWLVGALAARTPNVTFDGSPADCDWENFYSHMRAEILARRDPKNPPAVPAEIRPGGVA